METFKAKYIGKDPARIAFSDREYSFKVGDEVDVTLKRFNSIRAAFKNNFIKVVEVKPIEKSVIVDEPVSSEEKPVIDEETKPTLKEAPKKQEAPKKEETKPVKEKAYAKKKE